MALRSRVEANAYKHRGLRDAGQGWVDGFAIHARGGDGDDKRVCQAAHNYTGTTASAPDQCGMTYTQCKRTQVSLYL